MLLAPSVFGLFKWRQFDPAVLLLAVGWYLRFSLSNRDVEELLAKRSVHADPLPKSGITCLFVPAVFATHCDLESPLL
jgi:hypothetical protein